MSSRRSLALTIILVTAAAAFARTADVLSQFRLTRTDAEQGVFDTLWQGRPAGLDAASSVFRSLSPEARGAAVTAAAAFVRSYCESDAFRERYLAARRAQRPADVPATAVSGAEDVDRLAAEQSKALSDAQEALKNLPPEMRKMMEAAMKEAGAGEVDLDAQLAQSRKEIKASAETQKQAAAKARATIAEEQAKAAEFDRRYPANPDQYIALRLREFLDLTATVPAQTALVPRGGKMVFADPELEAKPELWKQLYRAGQPSVNAARSAATTWLATIEKS